MPQISVIIPVYNTEEYLKQCIDSVLNQEDIDVELILLDDGSTDKSVYICQKYSEKYGNIHFFKGKHGGVSDARNCGIKRAKGDYIMFLDSDDFLQPNVKTGQTVSSLGQSQLYQLTLILLPQMGYINIRLAHKL